MSFGGGFGGFGSNNNNQQSTFGGGGGFGANNNNNANSGFGSNSNTGSIFGNTGSTMFGGNNAGTNSPFGGGGAFGANNNTATTTFGSTPFGAAKTGSNLFGGGSTGSFGSGFGATTTNNATSAFGGGNNTGGGIFGGAAKPAFGAGTTGTTGSTIFGGGNAGGGFGASNTGTGFGASATTGFQGQQANQGPQPNNGTASTPFSAFAEKDGNTSQQHYQTITFQDPYKNYSLEELRAVDYNQGRRFGNQNGQAGAFGQSTGFGGFGAGNTTTASTGFGNTASTGGGLFGNNNTGTTSAFGTGNTNTTFGSSANTSTGGLFGQNKPATGGLFGGAATSQPAATGGLFGGGATANTGAFGSTGSTGFGNTNTAAGGLFGNTNTQTAAKPFGGFGASTAAPAASNPFGGAAANTGGGLFGGGQQTQATSTPFGGGQTQQPAPIGGLFGGGGGAFGGTQQTQTQGQSGGLFGGFGNTQQNQQKPAGGLFGTPAATTTGGGLFGGAAQQPQQTSSLFNNAGTQNNAAGGGLFGAKPATTGGLFGSTGNTGGTTGGLFGGAAQNTQQNTGGLFGQSNQQKPAGGLFGGSTTTANTGGGLFGGLGQNNAGGSTMGNSLFSSQNQQQQQQQPMGNSLFGASGNSLLQTSMNTNPYGNDTLFAGLNTPTQSPGPLATPLSSSTKTKKSAILPQSKLNPSASTRLLTPQNRGRPGYGFTYSTYGTPNSASSNGSPALSGSLFGSGSISRSLGKSLSTSNLRNSFTPETSILAPGAFSTNGRSFASGSLKKLNINRSINNRVPLFDEPSHDKKRVSFAGTSAEEHVTNGAATNGSTSSALVLREEDGLSEEPARINGSAVNGSNGSNGAPSRPEMKQVNGNAAAAAPQRALGPRTASSLNLRGQDGKVTDPNPGAYWSSPSLEELRRMSQAERRNVRLVVGRDQIGQIEFNMGKPVDLTTVDIEKLFGDIVQLNHRNATVYGASTTVPKPALGTGLNHPSRITLGNSWPRNRAGKKDQKHLERLKRVGGTNFENYNAATGDWIFTVPHFSTYGLNDSDYSDDEGEEESSELSPVPDTPAQVDTTQMTDTPQDDSFVSPTQSSPDDTFDFKKGNRLRASVPGGFGDEAAYEEDTEMEISMTTSRQSFLGERSVGSLDGQHEELDYSEEYESESAEDQDMADSVSGPIQTTEQPLAKGKESDPFRDSIMPKSILKAGQTLRPAFGTPSKGHLVFDDDWANQLQRTISPRKQDRHALRESQGDALRERDMNASVANFGATMGQSFGATTIPSRMDLMNDLFGETDKGGMSKRVGHGIELPYPKRPKTSNELDELSDSDKAFHSCNKPHFSESGTLLYANKLGPSTLEDGVFPTVQEPIIGAYKDIRFTKLPTFPDAAPETLTTQKEFTKIYADKRAPFAKPIANPAPLEFADVAKAVNIETAAGVHEHQAWQLLSVLFDEGDKVPSDMTADLLEEHRERYRKDKLSDFWKALVHSDAEQHAEEARTSEEKAIAYLSGHNVADACHALLTGMDLRLATMVAQIGGDHHMRRDMTDQLDEWRRMDVLSEMDEPIRALYELLSGNCAASDGKSGGGRENKISRFTISGRFGLDWRRAFGLRLWYGTLVDEPIELAVAQFADALRDNKDDALPQPWFVEQGVHMGWDDKHADDREDLLWGILKLYASSKLELPANIEEVLAPENVSGHPMNARLSFQLFQLFKARQDDSQEIDERKVGMPTIRDGVQGSFMSSTVSMAEKDGQTKDPLTELGDKLTLTYAASLHTPEHWTTALWVYMHLSSAALREHYIRSLLNLYSHTYSVKESDATYNHLVNDLRLPHTWLHAAAALQAKTDGNAVKEVKHLIQADEVQEAHEVLRRIVGPDAIITREYEVLNDLLQSFFPKATHKEFAMDATLTSPISLQMKKLVPAWTQGGGLYFAYISLLEKTSRKSSYRVDKELDREIESLLKTLQQCLEIVAKERWGDASLEERVALTEIAGTVADLTAQNQNLERAKVLRLPLTEDLWLKHTSELSVQYYRAVMTAAR